jgi:hypothetical protein
MPGGDVKRLVKVLDRRRRELEEGMLSVRSMCRGKIGVQCLKVHHKGKKEPVARGPTTPNSVTKILLFVVQALTCDLARNPHPEGCTTNVFILPE